MVTIPEPTPRYEQHWNQAALWSTVVAGGFTLGLAVLINVLAFRPVTVLEAAPLDAVKRQILLNKKDPALRQQYREMDARLLNEELRRHKLVTWGAWLMVGGAGLTLVGLKVLRARQRRVPAPLTGSPALAQQLRAAYWARWGVASLGAALLGAGAGAAALWHPPTWQAELSRLSGEQGAGSGHTVEAAPLPPPTPVAELALHWPRFRGHDGSGVVPFADIPDDWDGPSGRNILWKVAVPLPGHSSPVVWADRVYLTGATATERVVYCFDAGSGALVWQSAVDAPNPPAAAVKMHQDTSYAAPTLATDGRVIAAAFTTGELACLGMDGQVRWVKRLDLARNSYGFSACPVIWQDLVLIQNDRGDGGEESLSAALAFRITDGSLAWQTKRPVAGSWTSPILVPAGDQPQWITVATPWVIAYDPAGGAELWRAGETTGEIGASPVAGKVDDQVLVIATNPRGSALAVKAGGQGDVTATRVAWNEVVPAHSHVSPLLAGEVVFVLNNTQFLTCLDARTGERLWRSKNRIPSTASPSLAGGRLYLLAEDGTMWIYPAGKEAADPVKRSLGEGCWASPAFAPGRIYLRGKQHLYAIGGGPAGAPPATTQPAATQPDWGGEAMGHPGRKMRSQAAGRGGLSTQGGAS